MPPKKPDPARDPGYLQDMLEAAKVVASFVAGKTRDQYTNDLLLRSAVERQIEIIGEAARHLSQPTRDANPGVPLLAIITQRHRLSHEYATINDELIWQVASIHAPRLVLQIAAILEHLDQSRHT